MNKTNPQKDAAQEISSAILDAFISPNVSDSNGEHANVVDALSHGSRGIHSIAYALRALGTGDAATQMGAIEFLAKEIKEGSERIASAMESIAAAIADRRV